MCPSHIAASGVSRERTTIGKCAAAAAKKVAVAEAAAARKAAVAKAAAAKKAVATKAAAVAKVAAAAKAAAATKAVAVTKVAAAAKAAAAAQGGGGGPSAGMAGSSGMGDRSSSSQNGSAGQPFAGLSRAMADVVTGADGSPEFVVTVSAGQATDAVAALTGSGATLLRNQRLPNLGVTTLYFSFPRALSPARARARLALDAPSAALDLHHIYRRAGGPRVYHPAMLGDAPGRTCSVTRSVRVGMIDGAVNTAHPALEGVKLKQERFLGRGEHQGGHGHGTAVAGLIAGKSSAGPLAGLAPGVAIYAAEAFGKSNKGDGARLESLAASLDWLIEQDVQLINMSFSGHENAAFNRLLRAAREQGAVLVAAAGNDRSSVPAFPAASSDTIAVTAVDAGGRIYRRANSGPHIEFAAPGVDLYVAWDDAGIYRSGTSFAAPIVTALLAREAARRPISLDRARALLRSDARDLGAQGRDTRYGFGLVQSHGC